MSETRSLHQRTITPWTLQVPVAAGGALHLETLEIGAVDQLGEWKLEK